MTETQAREKLQKLLAITMDRGAARGEQENATRVMGAILQAHPGLRDMITEARAGGSRSGRVPEERYPMPQETYSFWQGVLVGVGTTALAIGMLVLTSLLQRGRDAT